MTGPDATAQAKTLIADMTQPSAMNPQKRVLQAGDHAEVIALAQAHFTAALAAATALGHWTPDGTMPQPDRMDWWQAASGEPAQRERAKDAECRKAATGVTATHRRPGLAGRLAALLRPSPACTRYARPTTAPATLPRLGRRSRPTTGTRSRTRRG